MLKSLIRPAMIFAAFIAGFLIPQAASFQWLIRYILMAMLFIVFLRVRFGNLRPKKSHWRVLIANIAMGTTAWLCMLSAGSDTLAKTAFFTGIMPTASAAPVIVRFLGENVEFAVTAFLITNTGAALSMVGLIPLVTGNLTFDFLGKVAVSLLVVIGIPMAAALLIRKIFKSASESRPWLSNLSFLMWVSMLFLTAASASHFIRSTPDLSPVILLKIALLSAVICICNFTLGYFIGEKRYRRESSQVLGQKNTMLLLYLAMTYGGPLPALGPTFYVLWHNTWNAIQMYLHDRRQNLRRKKREEACESSEKSYISEKENNR